MHDITSNFCNKLSTVLNSISRRMWHPFLSCKILVALLMYQLFLRLYQKPWKNWEPTRRMAANCPQTISFLQPPFWKNQFFTVIIRHPQLLRNCTLIPIPMSGKDPSQSDNYRPIGLALIWVRFLNGVYYYSSYLSTSDLQFGFKSGASTDSCTGLLKNTIALHVHRKTKV